MSGMEDKAHAKDLTLEYDLDAPPEKVWRAISTPALRERWLPGRTLVSAEPVSTTPDEEVTYRMRDDTPPFLESIVTFQVRPNRTGGTALRIVHELADARLTRQTPPAANDNTPWLMRAA